MYFVSQIFRSFENMLFLVKMCVRVRKITGKNVLKKDETKKLSGMPMMEIK